MTMNDGNYTIQVSSGLPNPWHDGGTTAQGNFKAYYNSGYQFYSIIFKIIIIYCTTYFAPLFYF